MHAILCAEIIRTYLWWHAMCSLVSLCSHDLPMTNNTLNSSCTTFSVK